MNENFLTVGQAAKLLDRSAESVRQYERHGKLFAIKAGRGLRLFRASDVQAFAQKQREREKKATR